MKTKILAVALLSIVGLAQSTNDASAFGLFPCCHRNCSVICCRPYNAFTPMCYGSMVCDGCCPSPCCGGGCCQPPPIQRALPAIYNTGCCDGGCGMPGPDAYAAANPMMMMAPPPNMMMAPPPMMSTSPPPPGSRPCPRPCPTAPTLLRRRPRRARLSTKRPGTRSSRRAIIRVTIPLTP